MAQTSSPKSKSKSRGRDDSSETAPSMAERGESGARIAKHLQKAATGGKIGRGFALWRISKELPTAAAGAGDLFKRHPIPIALLGGALTTAALLYAARSMGAFEAADQSDQPDGGDPEGKAEADAEGRADDGSDEVGSDEDDGDDDDADD